jgi:predicted AAA+ superfamily ATPase
MNQLLGHPVFGFSWEGYIIENIAEVMTDWQPWFFHTATGNEIDLILTKGSEMVGFECKASRAPEITKGTVTAMNDLGLKELYIVAPVQHTWSIKKNIRIGNLADAVAYLRSKFN